MSHSIVSKVTSLDAIVKEIREFLGVATPIAWVNKAVDELPTLLIDHANCEYKAAATGMSLLSRYKERPHVQRLMARLVREEMLHYEQVLIFMERMNITFRPLTASRYVKTLREKVRTDEPGRLTDLLIVGAIVEARSCERFSALWPHLPNQLGKYYKSLLKSEGRHYQDYLVLAGETASKSECDERLELFLFKDAHLITSEDDEFRFHSGIPRQVSH